jgi:glutathione synthase/RimK-type ligase-like ATP-grasp enzyme
MTQASADAAPNSRPIAATANVAAGARVAILTDGMMRKCLSAIRALGKDGFRVHVLGDSWLTVGFWSHFTQERVLVPEAKHDLDGFGRVLSAHLRSVAARMPAGAKPVLLPMEEDTLRYVVRESAALRGYADFLVPEPDALEACLNKGATMALAARLGLPHPRTQIAESAAELLKIAGDFSGSEFVVKPLRGVGASGVRYNPSFDSKTAEEYFRNYGGRRHRRFVIVRCGRHLPGTFFSQTPAAIP